MYTFTANGTLVLDAHSLPRALWRLCVAAWHAISVLLSVIWIEFLCLLDQWAREKLHAPPVEGTPA